MSAGLDKLRRHIDRMKELNTTLADSAGFFEAFREPYTEMARQIALGVLVVARPTNISPEEWLIRINALVAVIAADLIVGEEIGLVIYLDARQVEHEQLKFEDFAKGTFAKDTILAWVRAGRAEDPLGKQMDERDLGDSDETIASRVFWALYTGRSRNSAEYIRQYLTGETQKLAMDLLPAVLKAWRQTILPAIRKDWKTWVQTAIRGT